jgi:hypothetical protein
VKGFLSGARKMAHPREDETFFAGSSSNGSQRSQLMSHVESEGSSQLMSHVKPEGLSQQRRPVSEVLHNFTSILLLTDSISYDLCNFTGRLRVG